MGDSNVRLDQILVTTSIAALMIGCSDRSKQVDSATGSAGSSSQSENETVRDERLTGGRLVDLTHAFDADTLYWPTETGFQYERTADGITDRGYFYAAGRFAAPEHGGTHLDAPIHFYEDRATVDEIPLDRLVGEGVLVDVSDKCEANPDYQIGIADLRAWEEKHGRPLANVILLLRTGWAARWPDREAYLGTTLSGPEGVANLHFPGLDPNAARWLAEHRDVKAIGIDTASIDHGQSTQFGSHVKLFEHNIPVFENVADMTELPGAAFIVVALPMKIGGGTGAPLRIIAALPPT